MLRFEVTVMVRSDHIKYRINRRDHGSANETQKDPKQALLKCKNENDCIEHFSRVLGEAELKY